MCLCKRSPFIFFLSDRIRLIWLVYHYCIVLYIVFLHCLLQPVIHVYQHCVFKCGNCGVYFLL